MYSRIAYFSSATDGFTEAGIADIVDVSVRNNKKAGITGLLMFHDGNFFQTLEGPATAVEQCYARIANDTRHDNLIRLPNRSVEGRAFGQWSMGYEKPSALSSEHKAVVVSLIELAAKLDNHSDITDPEISILARNFLQSFSAYQGA